MDARKVDQFITAKADYFPTESIFDIKLLVSDKNTTYSFGFSLCRRHKIFQPRISR